MVEGAGMEGGDSSSELESGSAVISTSSSSFFPSRGKRRVDSVEVLFEGGPAGSSSRWSSDVACGLPSTVERSLGACLVRAGMVGTCTMVLVLSDRRTWLGVCQCVSEESRKARGTVLRRTEEAIAKVTR